MTVKNKIASGENVFGAHVNIGSAVMTEIFATAGYDFVWIDMEHTTISVEQVYHHILAAHAHGTPAFVRVPQNDLTNTKRVLELDVDGIIFPMAENAAHARALLENTLYPPYGKRGCGPKGAVNYGFDSESYYYGQGHLDKITRFVQIELKSAALDAEEIAKIPYLDGVILGMHDLSGSIGRLGDIFCEENMSLALPAIKALKDAGKAVGIATFATDERTLSIYRDMGCTVFAAGADYEYVRKGAVATLETLKKTTN